MKKLSCAGAALAALTVAAYAAEDGQETKKWDVAAPPMETRKISIDVTEGTWMNVDVSPDGRTIAFDLLGDIYTMPIAGGAPTRIAAGLPFEMQPKFSPDGAKIAFTSDRGGGDNLWIMNRDGSDKRAVTKETFRLLNSPDWSPDGRYLIGRKHFTTGRSLGTGEIWMVHLGGGDGVRLVKKPNDAYQKELGEPVFAPGGGAIYFSRNTTPGDIFQYAQDSNDEIFAIDRFDIATGETTRIAGGAGGAVRPTPSPDGKWLAFVKRQRAKSKLYLMDLATGAERKIYDALDQDVQETWAVHGVYPAMDWTPDSKSVVFWAGGKIRRVSLDGAAIEIPFHVADDRDVVDPPRPAVEVAPDAIAAAFGTRMATRTEVASTQPLPTTLAGASVRVNGVLARLFFVSPSQINFIIPAGIAAGAATVTVNSEDGSVLTGTAQVRDVAPAIVAANADGVGAPAAVLLRLSPAGAQAFESIVERDPASNKLVPKAINFGTGDRLFLILYVCGIRNAPDRDGNRDNGVAESIRVMFGGIAFQPIYAGPAPDFAGLDQINIEIDRRLSGRVSIQVEYEAITSNVGEMAIAWPGREAAAMSLSSSSVTSVYGQSVTFTAHVSAIGGTPTGSVIFRDGARSLGTGELIGGRAEFNAETLTVGTHRITAYYGGNGGFMGTWVALQPGQSVGKAGTTIELSAAANPTVTGQTATFIVQVSVASPGAGRPSGQLRFTDNGVLIGRVPLDIAGRAVLSVPLVTAGKHPISAAYEGDANFSESNGVLSGGQQVNKGATTIVVSSSQNPSGRDQSVTLIATVGVLAPAAGTPTGIVQFKDGGAVLGAPITLLDRRAELALSTLRLGAHLITAEYYGDPHFFGSASLIFSQNIEVPPLQVGRIVRAPLSYAGDEILIQGSGFSSNPSAHEVQMIDDQGKSVTAKVEAASPGQLRVRVPFGAGSGRVKVVLSPNEGESPDRLELATSVSGVVQQAVRQPDGSTLRAPVPGVTLRAFGLSGLIATAVTTSSGSFVVKFPAAASFFETIDLEVDGAAVPGGLPYPTEKRKMAVARSRDNPYSGDVDESGRLQANIIELKRVGAATALLAQGTRQSPTAAEIIFDRGGSTILCPGGGGNCALTLTALDPGRAPANLPIGYFSSAIAQITPFGATLAPGGRLSFPNVDGIPIGTPVRLFRFEQTSGPNLGKFVDVGSATVSSDGARIDTTANAVTQTSYYFVSRQWPRATIVGFVSEADGRPVRRAVVDVRGQSVFTDNNGGFVLGNVPVITSDGFNDPLVLEVTYARSDGRVDRAQRGERGRCAAGDRLAG